MIVRDIIQLETFDEIEKGDFVDIDSNKLAVIREKTAVGLVLEKTGNSVSVEVKRLICNFDGSLNIGDSAVLSNGKLVASSNGNFRILQVKEKAVAVPLIKLSEGGSIDLFAEYGGDDLPPSTDKIYSSEKISELLGSVIDTIYPIGAPYYQIVGQHSDPQLLYPNTVWEKLYDGEAVTVRTGGALADESRDPITGIQEDAMQRLTGDVGMFPSWNFVKNGVFRQGTTTTTAGTPLVNNGGYNLYDQFSMDNSLVARTSTETRMRNVLWNIWIRRA